MAGNDGRFSGRVPAGLWKDFKQIAESRGVSPSELLRELIKRLVRRVK